MIVYGDPESRVAANRFSQSIQNLLGRINPDSLSSLRTLLIQAGQFEQGLADLKNRSTPVPPHVLQRAGEITDLAATAFCSKWLQFSAAPIESLDVSSALAQITETLRLLELPESLLLNIKTPEGFEFYALFPEQYCVSALRWAAAHRLGSGRKALVIGLRSIGTTLSAAVNATLKALGWHTRRITVRPHGPAFQRQVELMRADLTEFSHALVVDEGPGISGSSMAATAQALAAIGVQQISFLPGHDKQPGSEASPGILKCWQETPRFFTSVDQLKWNGLSLRESLAAKAQELSRAPERFDSVKDLSGGEWRRFVFPAQAEWPAVAAQFERMKFRCANHTGAAVLWKFIGLGSSDGVQMLAGSVFGKISRLAEKGFTPKPLGIHHGFFATPWISGAPLSRADASPAVLTRVGEYLVAAAGPPLTKIENTAAVMRLAEMLYWNTRDAFDDVTAERTREWIEVAKTADCPVSYGDGHLAPHEWISTRHGILKTDCGGHDSDHTMVGRQSLLWDVAGAMTEWDLNRVTAGPLLTPLAQIGIQADPEVLEFYLLAYSAFRLGLMSLSYSQTSHPQERVRIEKAISFYRQRLARVLSVKNSGTSPSQPNHQSAAH